MGMKGDSVALLWRHTDEPTGDAARSLKTFGRIEVQVKASN